MELGAEQLLTAIERHFPREYEIAALRLVSAMQAEQIAELERSADRAEPQNDIEATAPAGAV